MIEYNFIGINDIRYGVTISYDQSVGVVTAIGTNGGYAAAQYESYYPAFQQGELIWEKWEDGFIYKLFWYNAYPFATFEKTAMPDPFLNHVRINSIVKTNETAIGANDGTAVINVSGGNGPYEYSLDGLIWYSGGILTTLRPQAYTIFVRPSDLGLLATGNFTILPYEQPNPELIPAVKDIIALSGAEISIQNAYKRVEVLSDFGKIPSLLYNGDFEQWDGQNFNLWTRYGGLNFSRIQRTVTNANGIPITIDNHSLQFNERSNPGKWIEASPIPVAKGDTLKLQYRVGKTDTIKVQTGQVYNQTWKTTVTSFIQTFYGCKIRIKVGNFYLRNSDYGSNYEWVTGLSTVVNLIDNASGDINTFSFNFAIPECPVTGLISIQLYGFTKMSWEYLTRADQADTITHRYLEISDYKPLQIDDINISKSSQSNDSDVTGILSISENLGYYTEKPDQIKILFGDYFFNATSSIAASDMYAIKYKGGQFTSGWYEYGTTTNPIAFGLALAKSILRSFQKPFRLWNGDVKLKPISPEFSYLNTFCFDVPGQSKFNNKIFILLGGDFDLKYNTIENAKIAENFDRPAKSNDITVPNYPGTTPPVFVQDPNGGTSSGGIFTEEFTKEFS